LELKNVMNVLADMGGDPGLRGPLGDLWLLSKRCDRTLPPGEVGSGVRGMPWLERGRNMRLLLVPVVEAEFGGDWALDRKSIVKWFRVETMAR
jgi:hypothetical protein